MILAQQDDEWQDGRRYFRPETMAAIDAVGTTEKASQPLLMASRSGARSDTTCWDLTGPSQLELTAAERRKPSAHRPGRRTAPQPIP